MAKELWEVLVPVADNAGEPFTVGYHRVWDKKVLDLTGGSTILPTAKGSWFDPTTGKTLKEKMIPVRILCSSQTQMDVIVNMTIKYYNQKAVLAYRISDEVILRYAEELE